MKAIKSKFCQVSTRKLLMFNIQNDTIINKIMRGFKTMVKSIINKLENVLEWVGYGLMGYKDDIQLNYSMIIKLKNEIKELKKPHYIAEYVKPIVIKLQNEVKDLRKSHEFLTNVHNNLARDFSDYKFANDNKIKALELAITMSKNDNNNLQESFNEYVLRPKAEKMIKEVEDYSYENELEQQQKEEAFNELEVESRIIKRVLKSREEERNK